MAWRIELTETAAKQIGKLDKGEAKRITAFCGSVWRRWLTHAVQARHWPAHS